MAAGVPKEGVTRFPNGLGLFCFMGAGAAAGVVGVTGILKERDQINQVLAVTLSGVLLKDSNDYTGEFTIKSNNFLDNTGGTSSAGKILYCWVIRSA